MIEPLLQDEAPVQTNRTLRQFAALWLLFFGLLSFFQAYLKGQVRHWSVAFCARAGDRNSRIGATSCHSPRISRRDARSCSYWLAGFSRGACRVVLWSLHRSRSSFG